MNGAVTQRESASLARRKSQVQILSAPPRVVVQSGSIHALGAWGRRFKSYLPDARVAQSGLEQGSCKAQVVGSNPISGSRVSYNGNTSAFQADAVGSIPSIRS